MTSDSSTLINTTHASDVPSIHTANDSVLHVSHIGSISTPNLSILNSYFVPKLSLNLLSVGQLCDLRYTVHFFSSSCTVQDPRTHQIIGTGSKVGRLFTVTSLHIPSHAVTTIHTAAPTIPLSL